MISTTVKAVKGGIFGNLEGSTKLKIFHASHDQEDVKSFTCKKAKRSVKLRQDRIIKGVKNVRNCCWNLYARKKSLSGPIKVQGLY